MTPPKCKCGHEEKFHTERFGCWVGFHEEIPGEPCICREYRPVKPKRKAGK
jgi:hypothetical protein